MAIHLIKLCVGAERLDDLEAWVRKRVAANKAAGLGPVHDHVTRMFPKRGEELVKAGSLYWVIRGQILARQRILGLETVTGVDGVQRCAILLDPALTPTHPYPRKAFQGWRYLKPEDAPPDLSGGAAAEAPALRAELAELGLL